MAAVSEWPLFTSAVIRSRCANDPPNHRISPDSENAASEKLKKPHLCSIVVAGFELTSEIQNIRVNPHVKIIPSTKFAHTIAAIITKHSYIPWILGKDKMTDADRTVFVIIVYHYKPQFFFSVN